MCELFHAWGFIFSVYYSKQWHAVHELFVWITPDRISFGVDVNMGSTFTKIRHEPD